MPGWPSSTDQGQLMIWIMHEVLSSKCFRIFYIISIQIQDKWKVQTDSLAAVTIIVNSNFLKCYTKAKH